MILKPERHKKGWGFEDWIANSDKYCSKLLFFEKDKKCSFHFHKIKDEVFYLQSGRLMIKFSDDDDLTNAKQLVMMPGDSFHVYVGLRHQMIALEDSELFEFSTFHMEEDSYRIVRGD